jgi:S1-C subfamily serine protease
MLLRLLMIGLCATGVILLATFQPVRLEVVRPEVVHREVVHSARPAPPGVRIVDVAEQVGPAKLAELVYLNGGERVSAINDRPIADDQLAIEAISSLPLRAGQYVDLTVTSATGERRVLVLLH